MLGRHSNEVTEDNPSHVTVPYYDRSMQITELDASKEENGSNAPCLPIVEPQTLDGGTRKVNRVRVVVHAPGLAEPNTL